MDDDPLIHEANPLTAVIEDWPVFLLLTSVILHRVIFERDEAVHTCEGILEKNTFTFGMHCEAKQGGLSFSGLILCPKGR